MVDIGDFLGLMDCVPNENAPLIETENSILEYKRKYSVQILSDSAEFLTLSIETIDEIENKFPKIFDELFIGAISNEKKINYIKQSAIKQYKEITHLIK